MMSTVGISAEEVLPASAAAPPDGLLGMLTDVMGKLESSLHGSTKAVLALDIGGVERETKEQAGLIREFGTLLQRAKPAPAPAPEERLMEVARRKMPAPASEEDDLRQSRSRILRAAALQSALLVRAQCKLRVLANMLAGPTVTYGPFRTANPTRLISSGTKPDRI